MRPVQFLAIGLMMLGGMAGAATSPASSNWRIYPEQAVMNAAAVAPDGVKGIFEIVVRGSGRQDGRLYLNSQRDYRDPRNLTVAIPGAMAQALAQRFGSDPGRYLIGKTIAVRGEALRQRIDFSANGQPSGKYYYQTHVRLTDPRFLTVEGETSAN